jgi:hypothetical protein
MSDLIDFSCTKCRRTSKNPDHFLSKTDLRCLDCNAKMKFQCPRCKLLFRQLDSAYRHARQICQIDDTSSSAYQRQQVIRSFYSIFENCIWCSGSFVESSRVERVLCKIRVGLYDTFALCTSIGQ